MAPTSPHTRRTRSDILRDIGGLLIPAFTIIAIFGFPVYIFSSLGSRVATGIMIGCAVGSFILYRSKRR